MGAVLIQSPARCAALQILPLMAAALPLAPQSLSQVNVCEHRAADGAHIAVALHPVVNALLLWPRRMWQCPVPLSADCLAHVDFIAFPSVYCPPPPGRARTTGGERQGPHHPRERMHGKDRCQWREAKYQT